MATAIKITITGGAVPGNWTEFEFDESEIRDLPVYDGRNSIVKKMGNGLPKIVRNSGYGNLEITFRLRNNETLKKLQLIEALSRDADNFKIYPKYISNTALYRTVILPTGQIPDELAVAGRNSGGKDLTVQFLEVEKYGSELFPITQCWYRNEEEDNLLATADGVEITVTAIDTVNDTITLSYLPLIESIWDPVAGSEWGLLNLDVIAPPDPTRTGDYTEGLTITGGDYATRVLDYTVARGADTTWVVGHKCLLFNPKISNFYINPNYILANNVGTWRNTYVAAGPIFKRSDGKYIMLANGYDGSGLSVGAFSADTLDGAWTVLNSDQAVFDGNGIASNWMEDYVMASGAVHRLSDGRLMVFISGYSTTAVKWRIGWVKFDEDFLNIEYASAEIIDSSASSNGLIQASVVKWNGQYRMFYIDRSDSANPDLATGGWKLRYADCATIDGSYVGTTQIYAGKLTNDGIYRSNHVDQVFAFMWKETLYLIISGTSWYKYSGNRGNRVFGLVYWDAENESWEEYESSPVFPTWTYGDDFWDFTWGYDHVGGNPFAIISGDDRYFYFFFSATVGSNSYVIGWMRCDLGYC